MHEKNKTESSLYTCIQSTLLLGMHGAERRVSLSLSSVVSVARRLSSRLLLCIWLARMAKGKGYKCREGATLHFLPSYAVSTAGRFLTLSLAIVLGVAVVCPFSTHARERSGQVFEIQSGMCA